MNNLENLKIDFENWYYKQEQEYATGKIHPEKIWKWFNESFPHERVVIQKNTEIFKMQLHQTIDLQDKEGFAIYGYLPYRYITRVPGGWIYSNYDTEKDAYVPMDKMFVPFNNNMQ